MVALRKESVDRNGYISRHDCFFRLSLSARRAWIEIGRYRHLKFFCAVALRKESVDRNPPVDTSSVRLSLSLSARRAWIEMGWRLTECLMMYVALRKESVDRNSHGKFPFRSYPVALRKESVDRNCKRNGRARRPGQSLSARRAWIEINFPAG